MNVLNETNYAETLDVIVTGGTYTGAIFAITEQGENVYIAAHLYNRDDTRMGDRLRVKVVPNFREQINKGNKWRAYFVEAATDQPAANEKPEPVWEPPTDEQLVDHIDTHGVVSTGDVVRDFAFGDKFNQCRSQLDRLHRAGSLVRADVYVNHDQSKASYCLWATHEDDFYYTDSGVS